MIRNYRIHAALVVFGFLLMSAATFETTIFFATEKYTYLVWSLVNCLLCFEFSSRMMEHCRRIKRNMRAYVAIAEVTRDIPWPTHPTLRRKTPEYETKYDPRFVGTTNRQRKEMKNARPHGE